MSDLLPQLGEEPKLPIERVANAHVFDVNGKAYIDFDNCKGSVFLGHAHPGVIAAVNRALSGQLSPASGRGDIIQTVAEQLVAATGCESVAFYRTGSAAVHAAMHAVRSWRKKPLFLTSGYHGYEEYWDVDCEVGTPNKSGIVDFYYDHSLLEDILQNSGSFISAAVISPDFMYLDHSWYSVTAQLLGQYGVPIIADEVKVGFRYGPKLALAETACQPVISVVSKALANGLPLAAVVGPRELLSNISYWRSTSWAEPTAFAAATVALNEVSVSGILKERIRRSGDSFIDACRVLFRGAGLAIDIVGCGLMFQFVCSNNILAGAFYETSLEQGLLFYRDGYQAPSSAFTDEVSRDASVRMSMVCQSLLLQPAEVRQPDFTLTRRFEVAWKVLDGLAPIDAPSDQRKAVVDRLR